MAFVSVMIFMELLSEVLLIRSKEIYFILQMEGKRGLDSRQIPKQVFMLSVFRIIKQELPLDGGAPYQTYNK